MLVWSKQFVWQLIWLPHRYQAASEFEEMEAAQAFEDQVESGESKSEEHGKKSL